MATSANRLQQTVILCVRVQRKLARRTLIDSRMGRAIAIFWDYFLGIFWRKMERAGAPPQGSAGRLYFSRTPLRRSGPQMQQLRWKNMVPRKYRQHGPAHPPPFSLDTTVPCAQGRQQNTQQQMPQSSKQLVQPDVHFPRGGPCTVDTQRLSTLLMLTALVLK